MENLHGQSTAKDGYKLFRWDRQGRTAGGVPCMLGSVLIVYYSSDGDDRIECLWERTGGRLTRQISWWESVVNYQGEERGRGSVPRVAG